MTKQETSATEAAEAAAVESDLDAVGARLQTLGRNPFRAPTERDVRRRALELRRRRQRLQRGVAALAVVVLVGALIGLARQRPSTTVVAVTGPTAEAATDDVPGASGPAALAEAVRRGDRDAVTVLLEAGVEPDTAGRFGLTPLMVAAARDDAIVVAALLDAGADPGQTADNGDSALHLAAAFAGPPTVEALLAADRGLDRPNTERRGQTPLMRASSDGRLDVIEVLLAAGADPSALDDSFRSVLHYASDRGDAEVVVARLMEADATWLNREGIRIATRGRPVADVVAELRASD